MQSGADVKAKIGREAAEQFAAPAPQPGELGPSGTALICACDDEKWALYKDGSPTMFSGGLLQALREGDAAREPMLGISDIYTLTRDHIIRMHRAVPLSCCASIESAVPRLFCVLAQSSGTRSRVHSCDTGGVLRAACGAGCHRNRARRAPIASVCLRGFLWELRLCSLDEPQDEQQDHRADEGHNDRADYASAGRNPQHAS